MDSAPGQGTTLYLNVPLPIANSSDLEAATGALDAPVLWKRPKPSRDVAEREGSVVLLAEDHPINRRVLVHQLGIIGFHVDTAEDGEKALELFRRGRYGLLLTDLNMPVMDGFDLVQAVRHHEAETGLPRTPVMALSANVMPGEAEKCVAAGMDDFAGKPTSMSLLAEKLRRWMPHVGWPIGSEPAAAGGSGAELEESKGDEVIDGTALDELTGGDAELSDTILVDYEDASPSDLAALRAAVAQANADDVRRHAHRIKGASRTVGAHEVATLAGRLEEDAGTADGAWPVPPSTVAELERAMARVAALVDSPSAAT